MKTALLLALLMFPMAASPDFGQTPHGFLIPWSAATIPPKGYPIAGYNVWMSSTSASSGFQQVNSALVTPTNFLVPAASLQPEVTYYFYVVTQDTEGNLSAPSNIVSGQAPAAWAVNPNAPVVSPIQIQ